jgi:hypothetical protein
VGANSRPVRAGNQTAGGCGAAACAYLRRGWSVVPLRPGEKRPLIRWETFQNRRAAEAELDAWYTRWPTANVGVVTGAVSGLVVLDVDPAHGGDESLKRLERRHGPLPPTIAAQTGGGGRHIYFRHPGGLVRNRVGFAQGIDLRGDGGYVVAPPSRHPSGRDYVWERGRGPDDVQLADMPDWLVHRFVGGEGAGHAFTYWRALVRDGVDEGRRNSTIASLTGHLLWHGVDADVALELLLAWNRLRCRPPLPDDEVASVVTSIARLHARQLSRTGDPRQA